MTSNDVVGFLWMFPGGYTAARVWVHSTGKRHRVWRSIGAYVVWPWLIWRGRLHHPPRSGEA